MKEQVRQGLALNTLHPSVTSVETALEPYEREAIEIDARPFVAAEKRRLRGALDAETRAKIAAIVADATRQAHRQGDQEEGQIRQQVNTGSDIDATVAARVQLMTSQVAAAPDHNAVLSVFSDAEFTGSADLIRTVGAATLGRLQDFARKDGGKVTSPGQVAFLQFKDRFERWQRLNPSPRERVEQIGRERSSVAIWIEQSAQFVMRLYGLGPAAAVVEQRPVPEIPSQRIKVGPNFDLMTGGHPSNARR